MINENIAYAKSILNKNSITTESPEYQDYIKIREICGNSNGYVGFLTKLRFVDNVSDMDEIQSIFDIIKNSKIDISKLNKMSYDDVLSVFYDELSGKKEDSEDIELVYKDSEYSYYKVHTYKGILKIGSPAWCLKTKSYWDQYCAKYETQWVVISNKYIGKLLTPDTNYLDEYKSGKGYIRYGVNTSVVGDMVNWNACSDNNVTLTIGTEGYTFFGVMCTILNLVRGIKKSYYQKFRGCEQYLDTNIHLVKDKDKFGERLSLPNGYFNTDATLYVIFSKTYSYYPTILVLDEFNPRIFFPVSNKFKDMKYSDICGSLTMSIVENYAKTSKSNIYNGVNLKLNRLTIDDIKLKKGFIDIVDKWLLFDHNDTYYLIVNSNPKTYEIGTTCKNKDTYCYDMEDPLYWYLEKKSLKPHRVKPDFEYVLCIINYLKLKGKSIIPIVDIENKDTGSTGANKDSKVKKFWNFIKNH